MRIGLNVLRTFSRQHAPALDAWFHGDESVAEPENKVETHKVDLPAAQIRKSLRELCQQHSAPVPAMPRCAEPLSPYQAISNILDSSSSSSRFLAAAGLLMKFMSKDCFVDMTMTSEGGASAVLRAPDGFRRTVVWRPDGTVSQRITGSNGEEVIRFNNNGEAIRSCEAKRENDLSN